MLGRHRTRDDASPEVSATQPTAAELVLEEARRAETALALQYANLDQKAGVLLAFAGVLVTLLAGTADSLPAWSRAGATGAAVVAALCSARVIGSNLLGGLSPEGLVDQRVYERSPQEAVLLVANVLAFLVADASRRVSRKSSWLKVAVLLLGICVVVIGIGLIVKADVASASVPTPGGSPS